MEFKWVLPLRSRRQGIEGEKEMEEITRSQCWQQWAIRRPRSQQHRKRKTWVFSRNGFVGSALPAFPWLAPSVLHVSASLFQTTDVGSLWLFHFHGEGDDEFSRRVAPSTIHSLERWTWTSLNFHPEWYLDSLSGITTKYNSRITFTKSSSEVSSYTKGTRR